MKVRKNIMVNAREMAMKTGVETVGAVSRSGALLGKTDKSGEIIQS